MCIPSIAKIINEASILTARGKLVPLLNPMIKIYINFQQSKNILYNHKDSFYFVMCSTIIYINFKK